ncbi:hypothetical protein RSJ22_17555 [Clostridium botulinum]|uniref:hypothetical protein n=1 Tax=Clostridium botulinum TaxID=1491 RepID=UPI000773D8CF|nr:hypothetical protein [Clostridium botulinum]APH21214.1 helix-turn-helix domain protein [Clostridium botulinum]AUN23150.1 hypothetical protein RSJ22_17555 [Clostridium botulinum]MBN3372170.1 hypothetical protein [Clostridium botulinum]MBN3375966.1 hypothetical protein [Clostridium botulinum]MBN3380549.1 hypothetical protein [Clostridium botulinum]
MSTKGFSQIDNKLIFDLDLSASAFFLYAKLQYFYNMDNFKLNREHIKSISGYGETAFRKAWKELKDKGILIQTKKRVKGKFIYEYYLKFKVESKKQKKGEVKKEQQKPVDSDGAVPMEGQIYIYDVLENIEEDTSQNISIVSKETGLNEKESCKLLEVANNDIDKVIECYKYVLSQKDVKNIFNYTKWSIRNNKTLNNVFASNKVDRFNDFEQRNYDFKKLENLLINKVGTYKECLRS